MVYTSLLACIAGFLLCLVAPSPTVLDAHEEGHAHPEGSGLPSQDSPSPPPPPSDSLLETQGSLSLQYDDPIAESQWWSEMEKKATRCLGCNKDKSKKRAFNCEDKCPREIDGEDFKYAIEATSLLNEIGEKAPGHAMRYVIYNSVVLWICNCSK